MSSLSSKKGTNKVDFVCSFFGRNVGLENSFRICLTFTLLSNYLTQNITVATSVLISVSKPFIVLVGTFQTYILHTFWKYLTKAMCSTLINKLGSFKGKGGWIDDIFTTTTTKLIYWKMIDERCWVLGLRWKILTYFFFQFLQQHRYDKLPLLYGLCQTWWNTGPLFGLT